MDNARNVKVKCRAEVPMTFDGDYKALQQDFTAHLGLTFWLDASSTEQIAFPKETGTDKIKIDEFKPVEDVIDWADESDFKLVENKLNAIGSNDIVATEV